MKCLSLPVLFRSVQLAPDTVVGVHVLPLDSIAVDQIRLKGRLVPVNANVSGALLPGIQIAQRPGNPRIDGAPADVVRLPGALALVGVTRYWTRCAPGVRSASESVKSVAVPV